MKRRRNFKPRALPDYIPETAKKPPYAYPKTKRYPVGDLFHARKALTFILSPTNAKARKTVTKAVAKAHPQYNWAAWWNSKRKGKTGVPTWSALVGTKSNPRRRKNGKVKVLFAEDLEAGYTSKTEVSPNKTLYYMKKLTILDEPEYNESFKEWYDTRVHIEVGSVKAKDIKNLPRSIQEAGFYETRSKAVYRNKEALEEAFYRDEIFRNPRRRRNSKQYQYRKDFAFQVEDGQLIATKPAVMKGYEGSYIKGSKPTQKEMLASVVDFFDFSNRGTMPQQWERRLIHKNFTASEIDKHFRALDRKNPRRRNKAKRQSCRDKGGKFVPIPRCLGSREKHSAALTLANTTGMGLARAWSIVNSQGAEASEPSYKMDETGQLKLFNPSKGITRKSDIKRDEFYTLWLRMPDGYFVLERTFNAAYIKSQLWDDMKAYNKTNKRQYVLFPQGVDPNKGFKPNPRKRRRRNRR